MLLTNRLTPTKRAITPTIHPMTVGEMRSPPPHWSIAVITHAFASILPEAISVGAALVQNVWLTPDRRAAASITGRRSPRGPPKMAQSDENDDENGDEPSWT